MQTQFEPHLNKSIAVRSKGEAKRPDVPDTPQPTGLADAQVLALPFVAMLTLAAVFVSSFT